MNRRTQSTERRAELLRRSAELRVRVAAQARVFDPLLSTASRVRAGARTMRRHPALFVLGGVTLVAVLIARPRAAARLVTGAWSGWLLAGRLAPLLRLGLRLAQRGRAGGTG